VWLFVAFKLEYKITWPVLIAINHRNMPIEAGSVTHLDFKVLVK